MILPRDQFYRILQASRVQTKEEKLAELERLKREKEAALVSCGVFCFGLLLFYTLFPTEQTKQTATEVDRVTGRQIKQTE